MKNPFTPRGKRMIYFEGDIYIITEPLARDLLLDRLNMAYAKGYGQAMKKTQEHSDKLLNKLGI